MTEPLDLPDIQGLVARGYGHLPEACFLLLAVEDAGPARPALRRLAAAVTSAQQKPPDTAVNVAITAPGVLALTGSGSLHPGFAEPFARGMTSPYRRRILGDLDADDPANWAWGGPQTPPVHLLVLLYARDPERLGELVTSTRQQLEQSGVSVLLQLDADALSDREHFGFKDGISQPLIAGMPRASADGSEVVRAGEFVLGYTNEYGQRTYRPLLQAGDDPDGLLPRDPDGSGAPDLGRNGTYLVFRQLEQDVEGFWAFIRNTAAGQASSAGPVTTDLLAAKIVGRWPSGAPLTLAPDHDDPSLGDANDFGYHVQDEQGLRCPMGAHIRRTNPRDSLDPRPGTEQSLEVNRRHRLLRRGRNYGEGGTQRGVHFLCIGANLTRQYEFIQHSWVNDPSFNGGYDATDPLVGPRHGAGGTFSEPALPVRRRHHGLPQFVHVRGGAYFFLPGLAALRHLLRQPDDGTPEPAP